MCIKNDCHYDETVRVLFFIRDIPRRFWIQIVAELSVSGDDRKSGTSPLSQPDPHLEQATQIKRHTHSTRSKQSYFVDINIVSVVSSIPKFTATPYVYSIIRFRKGIGYFM